MKKDVANFVSSCLTCQQVKAEHQQPTRLKNYYGFYHRSTRTLRGYDYVWVIVRSIDKISTLFATSIPVFKWHSTKHCHSPIGWFKAGEINLFGPDLVQEAIDKVQLIRQRLLTDQSRQKSYADKRRRDLIFTIRDKVFLRVSPMKGVMRFGKRAFHVSMLRKCISDSSQALEVPTIPLDEMLSYEEEPMAIVDRQTDGQPERTIQILEDMLRACILEFGGSWDAYLPLAEFAYNNSFHSNKRRIDLMFTIGDNVFLGVSPMKGVMRFGKRVFHVSMLRKCISDSSQALEVPTIPLDEKLSYEEESMAIVDRQVRKLQSKNIVFVKVLWRNHTVKEATREIEDAKRVKYPH
ncbi:uncharacterized protein [Nicotiana tomentosiformis]|uniref:uncharacterized protein n=1 Tax=Nicotiana tomentosiformis TaxID=4098 RepID=UPI00388C3E8A